MGADPTAKRSDGRGKKRIPLWLKVPFSAWILLWAPAYLSFYGPQNFLWLCDLSNFILLIALWAENRLLLSSQIVAVLAVDILWSIDFVGALLFGTPPLGGTGYMFSPEIPLHVRLMSLFHIFTPPLLIFAILRLGYHRRGLLLQILITWIVLPASYLFTDPERGINWVWGPFGKPQTATGPWVYLLLLMAIYPLVLYLPSHGFALWLCRRRGCPLD